ncbi:MAG: hypothetical protein ACSHX9_14295 [Luteolibacter sp.]
MKKTLFLLAATGFLGSALIQAQNCEDVAASVTSAASAEDANLLEIVDEKVSESPNCVCEIVKAAIGASEAQGQSFGDIVEAAGNAAPEKLQLIVDCASTVASDVDLPFLQSAANSVQTSNPGINNPLNFPGRGPVGPATGLDGGAEGGGDGGDGGGGDTGSGSGSGVGGPGSGSSVPTVIDPPAPVDPEPVTDPNP